MPSYSAAMEYITYSSSGGSSDFGDLLVAIGSLNTSVASNNTRGLVGGGRTPSITSNAIDLITIATTGNATDFGNLTQSVSDTVAGSDVHGGLGE